jgi:hypothetical protein
LFLMNEKRYVVEIFAPLRDHLKGTTWSCVGGKGGFY